MFNFFKFNLNTKNKLDGKFVMVGDVIAMQHIGGFSYYIVKVIKNYRGDKEVLNFVAVMATREESKFSNSYQYVPSTEYHISLYELLKKDNIAVIDNVNFLKR